MSEKKMLYDDSGNFSSMRLMSFIAFLAAIAGGIAIGFAEACGKELEEADEIVKWLLGAAFGPKAVQKFAEAKSIAAGAKTSDPQKENNAELKEGIVLKGTEGIVKRFLEAASGAKVAQKSADSGEDSSESQSSDKDGKES